MKRILPALIVAISMSGCTASYVGKNDAAFWKRACEIGKNNCNYKLRDFELNYTLVAGNEAEYTIQGNVKVAESLVGSLKNLERLQITIVYMDEGEVVLQNSVYTWGNMLDKNSFRKTFRSDKSILFSVPVAYAYRMTELE